MDNSDLRKLGFSEERNEKERERERDDHWYILVYITTLFYIFTFSFLVSIISCFFIQLKMGLILEKTL